MSEPFEHFSGLYARGIAVGLSDIKDDTLTFRFKDEVFTLPSAQAHQLAKWNGYFYTAEVAKLRKLKETSHG